MTKDELKARYGRIANDPSQLEMFKDDVVNGDVLTDVPAPTIEDAGKVLKVNAAGELEYGSGGGSDVDVSVHNLQVEASISTDGELIISNFQCDSLPENTWFEEPVCHVAFSITLLNEAVSQEPFEFANILHYYSAADVFTDGYWGVNFNLDENKLRVSWSGINLVLDDGTMIFDSGEDLNLYSHTISPIPADIGGGGSGDEELSAAVYDVIVPTLERHGLVSKPVFGYEDHLFCYGRNDYEIDRLDEDEVIDLITGARYYWDRKAGNALESPLYVSCSNGTYYLNYNGLDYPLQQDIASVDSLDDLTFYYWLGIDKGGALKLVFYYNIPASIPSTLELLSGEVPENYTDFMWYAFSDFPVPIPATAAIGTRDGVVCADDGIIQVEHSRPTDLVCMFAGSNGIIQLHYWIEGKEMVQLRSEADWSQYHLPGTGGSDLPDLSRASVGTFLSVANDNGENILAYSPAAQYINLNVPVTYDFELQEEGCVALYNLAEDFNSDVLQQITVIDSEKHKIQNIEANFNYQTLSFDIGINGINYHFSLKYESDPK